MRPGSLQQEGERRSMQTSNSPSCAVAFACDHRARDDAGSEVQSSTLGETQPPTDLVGRGEFRPKFGFTKVQAFFFSIFL